MAQLSIPSEPKTFTTKYEVLLGVDYRRDITSVDKAHSPDMVNMISDLGGNPVKRNGYRQVSNHKYEAMLTVRGKAYGIWVQSSSSTLYVDQLDISGYPTANNLTPIWSKQINGTFGTINNAFAYQQYIFILCQYGIIKFDTENRDAEPAISGVGDRMMCVGAVGSSAPRNREVIPATVMGLQPNGLGGTNEQDINVMSIFQTQYFGGDGTSKEYVIAGYEYISNYIEVEILNKDTGVWELQSSGYSRPSAVTRTGIKLDGSGTETYSVRPAKITFDNAPYSVKDGEYFDNVRITFAPFIPDKGFYSEQRVNLLASNISTMYDNRLFVADGSKTFYSEVNEPFSISSFNYFEVDNTIMCYTRTSRYLAIITKDDGRNTVFLATQTNVSTATDADGNEIVEYAYAVTASNAGVGAISSKCLGTLNDEPVFLSTTGLHALLTNFQSEKYAVNRSGKINRQLCTEANLETAVGAAHNDYYYIAINSRMYVLDSRNRESTSRADKSYECYFFDSVPSVENIFVVNNVMFFTDESATYRWNDDLPETAKYYDNAHQELNEEGELVWTGTPVKARWSSAFDDDGHPEQLKTLLKKGCMLTLMPHYRSGCEVTLIKNGNVFQHLGYVNTDMFTFENISFNLLLDPDHPISFVSNEAAADVFLRKKIKKYKRLQIVVENNNPEPFGIICIVKSYQYGSYAKR